ncbi:MAG TPA: hypothetical protein VKB41_12340 [Steroidobacteraceae bacterium]|nr:hypothetical protein [Steroidobacteraceae bacterium]
MRVSALLLSAAIWMPALAVPASEARLTEGAIVRIQSAQIEAGWHAGTIRTAASGCRMVYLGSPTAPGYESLTLAALARLQSTQPVRWTEVELPGLVAQEPRACHEELADLAH